MAVFELWVQKDSSAAFVLESWHGGPASRWKLRAQNLQSAWHLSKISASETYIAASGKCSMTSFVWLGYLSCQYIQHYALCSGMRHCMTVFLSGCSVSSPLLGCCHHHHLLNVGAGEASSFGCVLQSLLTPLSLRQRISLSFSTSRTWNPSRWDNCSQHSHQARVDKTPI